jgi:tetratricopeptide (TPR) repeat protein
MNPNFAHAHSILSIAYADLNNFPEAIAEGRKAIELSGGSSFYISNLGWIYAQAGEDDEAIRVLEELKDLSDKHYVSPFLIANIYVGLEENDKTFEYLEKAYEERYELLIGLKVNPSFDPIREDPRFSELLKKIGLE